MNWTDQAIETSIEILNECETVAQACNRISHEFGEDVTPSSLRSAFRRNGYDSPSCYLVNGELKEYLPHHSGGDEDNAQEDNESNFEDYEPDGNYYYNDVDDLYLVFVPHKVKPLQIPGEKMRDMKSAYSNLSPGGGATINEVCSTFSMSRKNFNAIRRSMGWTHDEDPFTDEEHYEADPSDLADSLIQQKRNEFDVLFRKRKWKDIENDAVKFREMVYMLGCEPNMKSVKAALEHISSVENYCKHLEVNKRIQSMEIRKTEGNTLIIPVSDLHVGKRYVPHNDNFGPFNNNVLKQRLQRAMGYIEMMMPHFDSVDNILYLSLGDNFESMFGNMREGQFLGMDVFGSNQYRQVIEFHTQFLEWLHSKFDLPVKAIFQGGNHDRLFANKSWQSENIVNFIMTDRIAAEFKNQKGVDCYAGAPIVSVVLGNGVNLISQHGHIKRLKTDKDVTNFISMHGKRGATRYLVGQGHLHSLKYTSGHNFKMFVNSSFCGDDEYNIDQLAIGSPPELILIESCKTTDLFFGPYNLDADEI